LLGLGKEFLAKVVHLVVLGALIAAPIDAALLGSQGLVAVVSVAVGLLLRLIDGRGELKSHGIS